MFCPSCGRENTGGVRFCATCGTNLEAVTRALSDTGGFGNFLDNVDRFIAMYSEHVFRKAPATALEPGLSKSWKLLGQGAVTSLVDMFLFCLMWNVLPFWFLVLLVTTPVRALLRQTGRQERPALNSGKRQGEIDSPAGWQAPDLSSVTEATTDRLAEKQGETRRQAVSNKG